MTVNPSGAARTSRPGEGHEEVKWTEGLGGNPGRGFGVGVTTEAQAESLNPGAGLTGGASPINPRPTEWMRFTHLNLR